MIEPSSGANKLSRSVLTIWDQYIIILPSHRRHSTWRGYKIIGLNFFRLPVNLATASCVWYLLVLSVTISRWCSKQFGSTLCLKWIAFLFSVGIMLSVNVKQSVNVEFCVRIGKSTTETCDVLRKVYSDECLSRTEVYGDECLSRTEVYGDECLSRTQVYGDECLSRTEVYGDECLTRT
jgi:hypothetical protein